MKTYTIQSNQVRGEERNIIKIDSSQNHSYNFLETEIKKASDKFTNIESINEFRIKFLGKKGIISLEMKELASLAGDERKQSDRIGMRSKIHPRDFTQKDMLLDMNISSTSAVNKYNKREKKERA